MAQEFAIKFYNGKQWKKCRTSFIEERRLVDGGVCQRCRKELGYIVHHKEKLTEDNISDAEVSLSFENLEYVCHDCHNREHGNKSNQIRCTFDEYGQPIPMPPY